MIKELIKKNIRKMMRISILLGTILILTLCSNKHKVDGRNQYINGIDSLSCEELILQFVLESDFESILADNIDTKVEEISEDTIVIKVISKDEDSMDKTIAWLKIDFSKEKLLNITFDPDEPTELNFKKGLYEKIKEHCVPPMPID